MPDPRDDLIRRGEITRLLTEADDRIDEPEDRLRVIANGLAMLPGDEVGAAALALAEATDANWPNLGGRITPRMQDAVCAYRSAVAGREAGR
ncbi:MAG: hypothetical protein IT373_25415 [Polyangiaceae bacterium]|nr:hypothetical protein [Polyangiaceae bacterium]